MTGLIATRRYEMISSSDSDLDSISNDTTNNVQSNANAQNTPSKKRGPYKNISNQDRCRLINAYCKQEDYFQVAQLLGINVKSAYSIIRKYISTNVTSKSKRGGNRACIFNPEMATFLETLLNDNPTITLDAMKTKLLNQFPGINISVSTIARKLDGMFYTLKKVTDLNENRLAPELIEKRFVYANWFLNEGINYQVHFIDEFGCNVWLKRSYGRSKKGLDAVRVVAGQRGTNVSACASISPQNGLLHYKVIHGSFNQQLFSEFVNELSAIIGQETIAYFIMDNAKCHGNVNLAYANHHIMYLPPYTPEFNPIEMAFSCIKQNIKKILAERQVEFLRQASAQQVNVSVVRRQKLEEIVNNSMAEATIQKVDSWCRHTYRFLALAINRQPLHSIGTGTNVTHEE